MFLEIWYQIIHFFFWNFHAGVFHLADEQMSKGSLEASWRLEYWGYPAGTLWEWNQRVGRRNLSERTKLRFLSSRERVMFVNKNFSRLGIKSTSLPRFWVHKRRVWMLIRWHQILRWAMKSLIGPYGEILKQPDFPESLPGRLPETGRFIMELNIPGEEATARRFPDRVLALGFRKSCSNAG